MKRTVRRGLPNLVCIVLMAAGIARAQRRSDVQPTVLIVQTAPGADISLDKVRKGTADNEGVLTTRVKAGQHVLQVERSGKQTGTKTIRVPPNKTTRLRVELVDYTADLEVYTTPGAQVAVKGKAAGVADSSGRLLIRGLPALHYYRLHAALAGFNPGEQEFRLTPGMLNTMTIDLQRIEAPSEPPASASPVYQQERTLTLGTYNSGQFIDAYGLMFTADSRVVGWSAKQIAVWDPSTGREERNFGIRSGLDLQAVSRDLKWCAVREQVDRKGSEEGNFLTLLLDVESGRVVRQHPGYYGMAFSPDAQRIVIKHPDRRSAELYDLKSGDPLQTWKEYEIDHFAFSPDGRSVATIGEDGVTIRDTDTGRTQQNWAVSGSKLRYSPDGRWIAMLGSRYFRQTSGVAGTIELLEANTGKRGRLIETADVVQDGVFTPDARRIIAVTGKAIQIWNLATGAKEAEWPLKDARRLELSADGAWMAVIGEHLTIWRRQ